MAVNDFDYEEYSRKLENRDRRKDHLVGKEKAQELSHALITKHAGGRPKADNPKTEVVQVRLDQKHREYLKAASRQCGTSEAAYLRDLLDKDMNAA